MDKSKQSKLDKIGLKYRAENEGILRNYYHKGENSEYSETHERANWDPENTLPGGEAAHGKGTQSGGHTHSLPNQDIAGIFVDGTLAGSAPIHQLDTENGGGSYDIWGRKEFESGREYLKRISLYNENHQYGKESVIVDEFLDGQYLVN